MAGRLSDVFKVLGGFQEVRDATIDPTGEPEPEQAVEVGDELAQLRAELAQSKAESAGLRAQLAAARAGEAAEGVPPV